MAACTFHFSHTAHAKENTEDNNNISLAYVAHSFIEATVWNGKSKMISAALPVKERTKVRAHIMAMQTSKTQLELQLHLMIFFCWSSC